MRFILFIFLVLFLSACGGGSGDSTPTTTTETTSDKDESEELQSTDIKPPVITLLNDDELILDVTQNYIEYGAKAIDDIDGDITSKIVIKNNINIGVEGNYTVEYIVTDSDGNTITKTRSVVIKDRLKELDTSKYKQEWFNKAKELWNEQNPDYKYEYDYYSYEFPDDGDRVAGTPPDEPILPKEWIQTAGLGFSKILRIPYEDSKYQYTDEQIKEWKSKGFRNGRLHVPLYDMVDLDKDPNGTVLKEDDLKTLKDICQLFVDNDIPITISIVSGDELADNLKDDRNGTFLRTIEWWRQLAAYFKDMSYLVAFENYVEYHGFDDVEIEKTDFKIELENNETHYSGYKNYRDWEITNWVRTPGYNNLMAEIARVVRITNPKRIFIYKPNGIGRAGLVNITPWRWGSEADYLGINNQKVPYWLMSSGGSANLKLDYINAIRSDDEDEKEALLASAVDGSWGPAVSFYNGTKIPVWIALFGIKVDEENIDSDLDGVDVTTDEIINYINWYQSHIQNDCVDENGKKIKISSGFQQSWWIWDYENQTWFTGTYDDRWEEFERVWETLSSWAKEF